VAFLEGANDGALNGTTAVVLIAAPAAATRRLVRYLAVQNRDTAAVVLTVRYVNGANARQIWSGTLQQGDTWEWGEDGSVITLDTTSKSIQAVLGGAPATTQPDFVATYADVT
jgi:hypothetical protein